MEHKNYKAINKSVRKKDGKVEFCYYGTRMHGIGSYTTNNKNKITCRFPDGQQIRFKYENDTLSAKYMDMVYSREGQDIYLCFTKTEPESNEDFADFVPVGRQEDKEEESKENLIDIGKEDIENLTINTCSAEFDSDGYVVYATAFPFG